MQDYACFPPIPQEVGWSALFYAAKNGQLEVATLLIEAEADVLLKDKVCANNIIS